MSGRASLPPVRRACRATAPRWGSAKRHLAPNSRLDAREAALYDDLGGDHIAKRLRLEQERISFEWARYALGDARLQASKIG
jgi:hypothetical protein